MALKRNESIAENKQCHVSKDLLLEDTVSCPNRKKRSNNKKSANGGKIDAKLSRPKTPPKISIDDPRFKELTTVEKLNDSKYRQLIYNVYPNEPTCSCLPLNRSTHPLICRSGCTRSCCMKLRDPNILSTKSIDDLPTITTYCTRDLPLNLSNPGSEADTDMCKTPRLRGGADIEQLYVGPPGLQWADNDAEYAYYDDRFVHQMRLEGGGTDYEKSSCGYSTIRLGPSSFRGVFSGERETNISSDDPCEPHGRRPGAPTSSCACSGREQSGLRKGDNSKCTKKPCLGVDCLIRAFREAQDFVDSLGKVPGLAGLGLMDPSDSPFFGRDIDRDYAPQESSGDKRRAALQSGLASIHCEAPCNTQPGKPTAGTDNIGSMPYATPTPLTIAVPGRTGIVREVMPTLPDTASVIASSRQKKRDEKREEKLERQKELDAASSAPGGDTDVGPCGEPKCKSRRKKPFDKLNDNAPAYEAPEVPTKRATIQARSPSTPTIKSVQASRASDKTGTSKANEKSRHQKNPSARPNSLGPIGDRNANNKGPIRVSKRVMRYVYTIGDVYPGINYGHKNCIDLRMRVPANMGWLWNTTAIAGNLKPRLGWKPGAIGRYLHEMLKQAKAGSVASEATHHRLKSVPSRTRKAKPFRTMSFSSVKKASPTEAEAETDAPPTLHIHRKDGTYYVTMYPIKSEAPEEGRISEPMKPLQFKIVKNKDDASEASSSSASDMEIEFSPPAAINRQRKKPDVIHVDTQVRQQQILEAFKPPGTAKDKDKKGKKDKEKDKEKDKSKKGKK